MVANSVDVRPTVTEKKRRWGDAVIEKLVFVVSYMAVLPIAFVARAVGWRWKPWPAGPNGYLPVLKEAWATASIITATVFSVR